MSYALHQKTFDPFKPFAWSYSKLKNFEVCPKRHFHVDVVGDFREGDSEQLKWGNDVHDALASAIGNVGGKAPDGSDSKPLPATMAEWMPLVEARRRNREVGAVVATELSLAINAHFQPTTWFGRDAWYRAKVDVSVTFVRDGKGVGLAEDWKTGKPSEDSPQLRMTALVMFAHYPEVERVRSTFYWLKHGTETVETINRADQPSVWAGLAPRVEKLRVAYTTPDPVRGFPEQPGHLCRRWCPVKTCRFHGT